MQHWTPRQHVSQSGEKEVFESPNLKPSGPEQGKGPKIVFQVVEGVLAVAARFPLRSFGSLPCQDANVIIAVSNALCELRLAVFALFVGNRRCSGRLCIAWGRRGIEEGPAEEGEGQEQAPLAAAPARLEPLPRDRIIEGRHGPAVE